MVITSTDPPCDYSLLDRRRILRRRSLKSAPRAVAIVLSRLVARCARDPRNIWKLSYRQFETLVAALLWSVGYNVTLGKRTHDGGKDIIAVDPQDDSRRVVVQCKRPRAGKRVGVSAVRELLGTVSDSEEITSQGMLVAGGYFTPAAHALFYRNRNKLHLRSLRDITDWMVLYLQGGRATCRDDFPAAPLDDDYHHFQVDGLYVQIRKPRRDRRVSPTLKLRLTGEPRARSRIDAWETDYKRRGVGKRPVRVAAATPAGQTQTSARDDGPRQRRHSA